MGVAGGGVWPLATCVTQRSWHTGAIPCGGTESSVARRLQQTAAAAHPRPKVAPVEEWSAPNGVT